MLPLFHQNWDDDPIDEHWNHHKIRDDVCFNMGSWCFRTSAGMIPINFWYAEGWCSSNGRDTDAWRGGRDQVGCWWDGDEPCHPYGKKGAEIYDPTWRLSCWFMVNLLWSPLMIIFLIETYRKVRFWTQTWRGSKIMPDARASALRVRQERTNGSWRFTRDTLVGKHR